MSHRHHFSVRTFLPALLALAPAALAQTEGPLLQIAQTSIGSNGFGTSWRGQDAQLDHDAWLTQIVFQTGSATPQVDEIRLMTAVPGPITLRTVTTFTTTSTEVTAVLSQPYLLRANELYTVWFHQTGTPLGTYGCDLTLVDPSWGGYHTNVDPTMAPGAGEPNYYWHYQYGTNVQLIGYDNLDISGPMTLGSTVQIQLETQPLEFAVMMFSLGSGDMPLLNFTGPLRLDPALLLPAWFFGNVGPTGVWINQLPIPNNASLHGLGLYVQALYDPTFTTTATFSPMEPMQIQ